MDLRFKGMPCFHTTQAETLFCRKFQLFADQPKTRPQQPPKTRTDTDTP
uniref:Uncharacterized protein n=1 Tax=Arundo donax TaxID=35708 RepID=A0A0A9H007_ARUDO